MIDQKDVTIIIPSLNRDEQQKFAFTECVKSLEETVPDIKKIIAVNGHSFEEDLTLGTSNCSAISNTSIVFLEEQGQCKAVNAAVATTNTPWIFVTNDDMIYAPGWWEELIKNHSDDLACVSPKLIEPRPGAPTFEVYFCGGAGGDFDKQKWLTFADEYMKKEEAPIRTGFNFPVLIRRDLWNTVEAYDINYDPWGSNGDSDLEYKIKLAGIQPYQNPNSIVYHFSQTSGTFEPKNHSYWQQNWDYFIKKWGFPRTDNGIWEASFKIPTKEEGRIFNPSWEGKYDKVN